MSYLLGVDVGTSVVKAALFDRDLNEIAVTSRKTTILTPHPGWTETSMSATWERVTEATRSLLADHTIIAADIAAVGVTGNMVGAWLVDGDGRPLRDAILHIDNRTQLLIEQWTQEHDDFAGTVFRFSGSAMQPGCTLPVIRWLADHEPDTLDKARYVLCAKDWIIANLTGTYQIDPSEASVMPGDTRTRSYADPLFDLMGVREQQALFPPVVPSEQIVGSVTQQAAEQTGLRAGTPVVAGAGDVLATGIGVGAVQHGTAYAILGTAGINGVVTESPIFEPEGIGLMFCQPGGRWVRVMVNTLGTPNMDWCIRQFFRDLHGMPDQFKHLEQLATQSGAGANGVIYLPYLSPTGVFAPFVEPAARAQFYGLSQDHTRDDMLRAVYEGIAFSIRHCYDAMPVAVNEIRLTGGGANSAFWCQLIADVTGKRVIVPSGSEFGARGSAILAGIGIGWFDSVEAGQRQLAITRAHEPQRQPAYEQAYRTYVDL
ncbi:MAG: FGGY-family carbohydrate kinase, partial [Chloroflexota bacterium]